MPRQTPFLNQHESPGEEGNLRPSPAEFCLVPGQRPRRLATPAARRVHSTNCPSPSDE